MLMANQVSFAAVKPPSVFRKLLGNEVMNLFCKGGFFFWIGKDSRRAANTTPGNGRSTRRGNHKASSFFFSRASHYGGVRICRDVGVLKGQGSNA